MAQTKRTTTKKATKRSSRKSTKAAARKPAKTTKRTRKATKPAPAKEPKSRDPRLPPAGTTITRPYKGTDYEIEVLEQGFRWDGDEYRSLSALASAITGHSSINGFLWARLTEPWAG